MEQVFKVAFEVLAPVLVAALLGVVVQIFRRLGLSISAEHQGRAEKVVTDLILKYEEKAAAAAKAGVQPAITKLEGVVADALKKLPNMSREEIDDIVHAKLPQVGVGAAAVAAATFRAVATKP
jgi:hypothetical protein